MTIAPSILLFVLGALAEIGGARLVRQGVREGRDWAWIAAGSIALDGFRPDRYDVTGALICLAGVAVIMYAPRAS